MSKDGQSETCGGQKEGSSAVVSREPAKPSGRENDTGHKPYKDMQSAPRFPLKLPVAVRADSGKRLTETKNISANGVLFQVDTDMPVGSIVDFTISLPADVVGSDTDVLLDCKGRVVRNFEDGGRRGVGVVIDEYHFERS